MPHHAAHSSHPRARLPRTVLYFTFPLSLLAFAASAYSADDAQRDLQPNSPLTSPAKQSVESLVTADQSDAANARIRQLIRKLGDPHFTARRSAANEIRQIGAEAFD